MFCVVDEYKTAPPPRTGQRGLDIFGSKCRAGVCDMSRTVMHARGAFSCHFQWTTRTVILCTVDLVDLLVSSSMLDTLDKFGSVRIIIVQATKK